MMDLPLLTTSVATNVFTVDDLKSDNALALAFWSRCECNVVLVNPKFDSSKDNTWVSLQNIRKVRKLKFKSFYKY